MIFGFHIMTGISEDLAFKIGGKLSRHYYDMPVNNSIRSMMVNYSFNNYYLWLNINASVLVCGKETVDIEFVREQDFSVLDKIFKLHLSEIFGKDIADMLPLLKNWGLHIMRYGLDVKVEHIDELMRILEKTSIPANHLNPQNAISMIPPFDYPYYKGKLELYPKAELIKLNKIDYKGFPVECERDILRLVLIQKRNNMGSAKRLLKKFEMSWNLESFFNPLIVTNTIIKAYLDMIGNGDFFKYQSALEYIEDKVSNFQKRRFLTDLVKNGSNTKKDLKLLRDIGINGVLLDPDSKFYVIKNPFDEILFKCNMYTK